VTAASYGTILSGTTGFYPRFTVDADGRLTVASTVPFTFENPLTFGNGLTRATNSITINAGLGLTLTGGALQINLASGNTTTTTSTVSGLEMTADGLRMIGGCSNNQLLAWNGSNWNCASVSSLGGVLGSGTDNYLARWNGTGALERSTIYETDGGQVGIGVTSPNDTFEIAGNVTIGSGYAGSTVSAPANGLLVEGFVGIGLRILLLYYRSGLAMVLG
jgi:hypothetical protein